MGAKKLAKENFSRFGIGADLFQPQENFGLKLYPLRNSDFWTWIAQFPTDISNLLLDHGALVLKDFGFSDQEFKKISDTISPSRSLEYTGGTSPRGKFKDVYESTYVPPGSVLPQHLEMCYFKTWPQKIYFYCDIAPAAEGETPFCSNRLFTKLLDKKILKKFDSAGVQYVRTYIDRLGSNTWQRSFQTENKAEVEAYCKQNEIDFTWLNDGGLKTKNKAQGCAVHPITKERLWFNHSYPLNTRSDDPKAIPPGARDFLKGVPASFTDLLLSTPTEELTYNTYYGDTGKPIEFSVLMEIDGIYQANHVKFKWAKGDLLLLDNMLASHGKNAFSGPRRILVDIK